jgi:hypothetical protein
VLDATAERGEVREGGFPEVKDTLEEACKSGLLLRGNGDGAVEGVDDHAGVRDTLGGELALVVAEAEAELVGKAVPSGLSLGAPGGTGGARADWALAVEASTGRVGGGLGDEDGVVNPDGAVERSRLEAAAVERGKLGGTVRGGRGAPGAGRRRRRRGALDATHEHVEGGAGVALSEVGGSEAADEAVDAKTAHGLVAEAEARGGATSRQSWTTWPCSSMAKTRVQKGLPVQPEKILR